MNRIWPCILLVAAASACDVPVATRPEPAYNPTSLTNGFYYRWASGSTVSVWVEQGGLANTIDLAGAVQRAEAVWNAVPQYSEVTLVPAASAADANIIVFDASTPFPIVPVPDCTFDPRGAGGYTYLCAGEIQEMGTNADTFTLTTGGGRATVLIRVDHGRVTTAVTYDALVAHEFGHALGIGAHSDNAGDLMFANPAVAAPSTRDKATLRFILGRVPDIRL